MMIFQTGGWLSTRKLSSQSERMARKARVHKVAQQRIHITQVLRVGSVVSSLSVGKLLPIQEGRKKDSEKEYMELYSIHQREDNIHDMLNLFPMEWKGITVSLY